MDTEWEGGIEVMINETEIGTSTREFFSVVLEKTRKRKGD